MEPGDVGFSAKLKFKRKRPLRVWIQFFKDSISNFFRGAF